MSRLFPSTMRVAEPFTHHSFPSFPMLPAEIRQEIWAIASHHPRNIDVWVMPFPWADSHLGDERTFGHFFTTQPAPGVLYANSEARTIGMRFYQRILETNCASWDLPDGEATETDRTFQIVPNISFVSRDLACLRSNGVTNPFAIWQNIQVDRICPMGPTLEYLVFQKWLLDEAPGNKFAVNAATAAPGQVMSMSNRHKSFHEEVVLYHSVSDRVKNPGRGGPFAFVDATQEDTTQVGWSRLNDFRRSCMSYFVWHSQCEKDNRVAPFHEKRDIEQYMEDMTIFRLVSFKEVLASAVSANRHISAFNFGHASDETWLRGSRH